MDFPKRFKPFGIPPSSTSDHGTTSRDPPLIFLCHRDPLWKARWKATAWRFFAKDNSVESISSQKSDAQLGRPLASMTARRSFSGSTDRFQAPQLGAKSEIMRESMRICFVSLSIMMKIHRLTMLPAHASTQHS